jgi:aldehyde dehydrogenase (NAD+)
MNGTSTDSRSKLVSKLGVSVCIANYSSLLKRSKGSIKFGGETDRKTLTIRPTVVADVTLNGESIDPDEKFAANRLTDALMEEELFGPVCPVLKATTQEACNAIRS